MMAPEQPCIAIYGASGFGSEVMPLVRAQQENAGAHIAFVDDNLADGTNILTFDDFRQLPYRKKKFVVAIANSAVRETLVDRCLAAGFGSLDVRAESVVKLDNVKIGEGAILCAFSLLSSNLRIGRFFHANYFSYVAHDCIVGDFVTLAPGAKCNGNVQIDDHAYVGSGAVIKQGTPERPRRIGRGAMIGMGAVVTRDVAPGATVIGNPARAVSR